ncbi:MAG: hypothetical protein ACTSQE_14855 [Candidatus Heimdallarchaeaceae archaeon]
MSKEVKRGFVVHGYTLSKFSYLEGRIRTIVETLGLPERQEKALSQLIVNETWSMWDKPEYSYQYEVDSNAITTDEAKLIGFVPEENVERLCLNCKDNLIHMDK